MKDHILSEIRRITALNDGKSVGENLFAKETGIAQHKWRGVFWANWGDALAEAGVERNTMRERLDGDRILYNIVEACRHYGHFPTKSEFQLYQKHNPEIPVFATITRHFGRRSGLIAAVAKYATEHDGCADIAAMLPKSTQLPADETSNLTRKVGYVYLMKMGNYYKIGKADELEKRMKQLSAATPEKPQFVHFMKTDDPYGFEAYWHIRFKNKQTNGEYFKLSSSDVASFKKLKHY